MLAGAEGEAARRALRMQIEVGEFFGAEDFVPVTSAHMHAEMEAMGEPGLAFVEEMAALGARVRVPATCDPRSVDFSLWRKLGQEERQVKLERRLSRALKRMGIMLVDSCINYQTVMPPRFREHLAWGDTGAVIYANAVAGARSNFEGGPVALAAAITGRVPRYGYHLPEQRLGTALVDVRDVPRQRSDWAALGCAVGRQVNDYWQVPVFVGLDGLGARPNVDDLKVLGAALASYGSLAMYHVVGVTPEARTLDEACGGREPQRRLVVEPGMLAAAYRSFAPENKRPDLVVFSAPQLSLQEMQELAGLLRGNKVHPDVRLVATTNYQNWAMSRRLGFVQDMEKAGALVVQGACFYMLTPRQLRERFGYRTLVTDSAKLANIIAAYGYNPVLRPTEVCVETALEGELPW